MLKHEMINFGYQEMKVEVSETGHTNPFRSA